MNEQITTNRVRYPSPRSTDSQSAYHIKSIYVCVEMNAPSIAHWCCRMFLAWNQITWRINNVTFEFSKLSAETKMFLRNNKKFAENTRKRVGESSPRFKVEFKNQSNTMYFFVLWKVLQVFTVSFYGLQQFFWISEEKINMYGNKGFSLKDGYGWFNIGKVAPLWNDFR